MNLPFAQADLIGMLLGLFLTLSILSYWVGDNVLFRLAIHIFIGAAAGLALATVWYSVLMPQLVAPWLGGGLDVRFVIPPLLLALLLLTKTSGRLGWLGNPVLALLVGIGAATAVAGAILGTIFPQIVTSINVFAQPQSTSGSVNPVVFTLNAAVILLATVTSLAYFQFGAKVQPDGSVARSGLMEGVALIGQIFIAITLGVILAGVYAASLAALVDRLTFIVDLIRPQFMP
jgi:hypothetical protein